MAITFGVVKFFGCPPMRLNMYLPNMHVHMCFQNLFNILAEASLVSVSYWYSSFVITTEFSFHWPSLYRLGPHR